MTLPFEWRGIFDSNGIRSSGDGVHNVRALAYAAVGNGVADDRAAFAACDTAAGTGARVVPAGLYRIGSNLTLTGAVTLMPGAVIKPDAGVTLTLNGPINAGLYQVFDASNAGALIVIAPRAVPEVFPQWWGAPVNGSSDDCAAVALAVASTHPKVRLTAGSWFFADGTGVTLRSAQQIVGDGVGVVAISVKNAYAFQTPTTGNLDRVYATGFWVTLRAGSTSGGAIKAKSNSFHSGWRVDRVYATGQTGSADPLFYLDGYIGSGIRECFAEQAQIGIKVSSDSFASNASRVVDCNVQTCTVKGVWLSGTGLVVVSGGIVESNTGYPIVVDGSASAQVDAVWLEDNSHGLMVMGTSNQTKITKCRFHYHHAGSTDPHIILTGPGAGTDLLGVQVYQNEFVDASGSGTDVTIDANTGGTQFGMNRWHNTTTPVSDLGTGTVYFQNDVQTGQNPAPNRVSGFWEAAYDPFFDTKHPTLPLRKRVGQNTDLIAVYDTDSTTLLAHVDQNGMGVFNGNSVAIKTKAAAVPNDGDVVSTSLRGGILMLDDNGASSRLYIRCGDGVWRYATLT